MSLQKAQDNPGNQGDDKPGFQGLPPKGTKPGSLQDLADRTGVDETIQRSSDLDYRG